MSLKKTCLLAFSLLLSIFSYWAAAQPPDNAIIPMKRLTTAGFVVGYGKAVNSSTEYQIAFFAADISNTFTPVPRKKVFSSWYLEPQINPVKTIRTIDIEFGLNAGIRTYVEMNDKLFLYSMIGTGPHYISAETARQANGFIFSDNAAIGAYLSLVKKHNQFVNLQVRYRHISNAGFKKPNKGIDSWSLMVGVSPFRNSVRVSDDQVE